MDYVLISLAALGASFLTFFSGFGLGTILLPVFILFFPVEIAVALTAVVHLLNNLFKLAWVAKYAQRQVVIRFGLPAIFASIVGAYMLSEISTDGHISINLGRTFQTTPIKLVMGTVIALLSLIELLPFFKTWQFKEKYLPLGGLLSGFFGGLSGHQGAFRSMFLVRAGLSKQEFIATGVVIACLVDFGRLFVYGAKLPFADLTERTSIIITATISAFVGVYFGQYFLKKVTLEAVQKIVGYGLLLFGVALALGLI